MSEDTLNEQHIFQVRSLYTASLKLLKDQAIENDYNLDAEKYTHLRLELQKLGFASIYNLKKCAQAGVRTDEGVLNYMEKRFHNLNESILAAYHQNTTKKGVVQEIRQYLSSLTLF